MPYEIKKSGEGFKVFKKGTSKAFSKSPMTKKEADAQLKALYANTNEGTVNESNVKVDNLLKVINTKKAGPEYKKALMDLIAMAEKKTGKTINTKKEALLALDYNEPSIKESKTTMKKSELTKMIQEIIKEVITEQATKLKSRTLTEGQFSWMTHDSNMQIGSQKENTISVTMFDDKGNKWSEDKYDGYGEFGGKDYYELLAQMNGVEDADRQDGIDIAFGKKKVKGKVLFPALIEDPRRFNWKLHDFTKEAEYDTNQSWYQEPEEDDDNGEDYDDNYYDEDKDDIYENKKPSKTLKKDIKRNKKTTLKESIQEIIKEVINEYSVYQGDVSKIKPEETPKEGEVYLKDLKIGDKFSAGKSEYIVVKPDLGNSGVEVKYADGTGNMKFRGSAIVKVLSEQSTNKVNEAYVPNNIKEFAKRKGASSLVNKVAAWAEKCGKGIRGGTAIGKNYSTLVLDLGYQDGAIRINLDNQTVTLYGEEVFDVKSFKQALDNNANGINESADYDTAVAFRLVAKGNREEALAALQNEINKTTGPTGRFSKVKVTIIPSKGNPQDIIIKLNGPSAFSMGKDITAKDKTKAFTNPVIRNNFSKVSPYTSQLTKVS